MEEEGDDLVGFGRPHCKMGQLGRRRDLAWVNGEVLVACIYMRAKRAVAGEGGLSSVSTRGAEQCEHKGG